MLAVDRLLDIEETFSALVERIVPVELDGTALRVVFYLKDGGYLRITEKWENGQLILYSDYWLSSMNELKTGWDNALHHNKLESFPHHKHVGKQKNIRLVKKICG